MTNQNNPQHPDRRNRNQRRNNAPLYTPIGIDLEIENKVRGLQRIVRMDAMNRYLNDENQDELTQRLRLGSDALFSIFQSLYDEIVKLWPQRPTAADIRKMAQHRRHVSTEQSAAENNRPPTVDPTSNPSDNAHDEGSSENPYQ